MLHGLPRSGLLTLLMFAATALPGATNAASAPASPLAVPAALTPPPAPPLPAAPLRSAIALASTGQRTTGWPADDEDAERIVSMSRQRLSAQPSLFESAQIVSFYGYPGIPRMGALGADSPERVADEVVRVAAEYDALNGERDVIPALHLIVGVAHTRPGADGAYLTRMPDDLLTTYVELARERGLLLFLDIQVGWADPLEEVQRLENFLAEPFVHLALDPEFAMPGRRARPGTTIGSLGAADVNAVQRYLAGLVAERRLPPKIFVLHQFLDRMLTDTDQYEAIDAVEVIIDMDGFGPAHVKLTKYEWYALAPYSERAAIKLFYDWDAPLLTPERLQALERPPDLVIYQ